MTSLNSDVKQKEGDRLIYDLAYKYLLSQKGVTEAILLPHLDSPASAIPSCIEDLFHRLIITCQNRGMSPSVIGNAIGGIENLKELLFGFNPKKVVEKYASNSTALLNDIETTLRPKNTFRKEKRSIWPLFCVSILSSAEFLSQFETAEDFFQWAKFFDCDDRARPALPMIISNEIRGVGFALACDFLKEIGFLSFGKPDVHLKNRSGLAF